MKEKTTNDIFTKGQFVGMLRAQGIKPSKAAMAVDEGLSQLTRDQLEEVYQWLTIKELAEADPERRREILNTMVECPCCKHWLGHNRPPADESDPPYRARQTSFDFDEV